MLAGGTLPSSAEVTTVDDAIHENEDYIELVDPNRLGGMVARRALKLYVVKVPPPPSVPVAERYENGKTSIRLPEFELPPPLPLQRPSPPENNHNTSRV